MRTALLCTLLLLTASQAAERPIVHPENLHLLPVERLAWHRLHREHPEMLETYENCYWELRGFEEDPDADDSAWGKAERRGLKRELARALATLADSLELTDADLTRLAAVEPGFGAAEIMGLEAVQATVSGDGPEHDLLEAITTKVLERTRALCSRVRNLEHRLHHDEDERDEGYEPGGASPEAMEQEIEAAHERLWQWQERYWQLLDILCDDEAKRALRQELPMEMREIDDVFEHAMCLSGLTVGQAVRIRALQRELESEGSADEATLEGLHRKLETTPEHEHDDLFPRIEAAERRLGALHERCREALREILTAEQRAALQAIPPRVSVDSRLPEPRFLFRGLELDDDQIDALVEPAMALRRRNRQIEERMERMEEATAEMGADTPQREGMEMQQEMMMRGTFADLQGILRQVFLDVLRRDQIEAWIVQERREE